MREVKMYQCEICKEVYNNAQKALECESRGKEIPLAEIGNMVDYKVKVGGGFSPFYVEMRIKNIEDKGHLLVYQFEEYDEEDEEWYESSYCNIGVWTNEDFLELCTLK